MRKILSYVAKPLVYLATATSIFAADPEKVKKVENYTDNNGTPIQFQFGDGSVPAKNIRVRLRNAPWDDRELPLEFRLLLVSIEGIKFLYIADKVLDNNGNSVYTELMDGSDIRGILDGKVNDAYRVTLSKDTGERIGDIVELFKEDHESAQNRYDDGADLLSEGIEKGLIEILR